MDDRNFTGLSDGQLQALSSIYVSLLSLSLIGSCSVVVLSIVRRGHLKEQAKPLFQLALADFLASLVLFGTTIMNFLSYETLPCTDGLALSLMFYCISFLLVIIYACESAHSAQGWREDQEQAHRNQGRRRAFDLLYVFVWLTPMMGYVIYIRTITLSLVSYSPASDASNGAEDIWSEDLFCNSCILFLHLHVKDGGHCSTVDVDHNNFIRGFTFASVLSVLTCCFLVYWRLQSWYRRYEQAGLFTDSQRCTGRIWSSARYMIVVIIFCWTPALVLISFSFATPESNRLFPLFVVQAVTVSLQGFLNSIVYGWRRRNFREAVLGERLPLMAYANRAFFEQSLSDAQQ
ncbi:transmembrane protein 116 [Astyanax mexicanus]|uniref:transmembrane protein 116 n=1 Tax=Astyanax mexicanus TaxID=7994 RepID=UPI0020CAD486|nr:transmembrane protein 116 [Astyanax mexicanus]